MSGKRKNASKNTAAPKAVKKAAKPAESKHQVTVKMVSSNWKTTLPKYRGLISTWSKAALKGSKKGEIAVVLADDAFVQDLNHTYRGKNKPTNVLSFTGSHDTIGDIVLAHGVISKEALEQGKTFLQHTAHLVVHGCLHLQGHDHENTWDARAMEAKEIAILSSLGFPNPYKVN